MEYSKAISNLIEEFDISEVELDFPPNSRGLKILSSWSDDLTNIVNNSNVKAIDLNYVNGWTDSDLTFLLDLEGIEYIRITSPNLNNIEAIESLKSLKKIAIPIKPKGKIDFSKLPNLKQVFISWWSGASSVFDCYTLNHLYIDKLKLKDYTVIRQLQPLDHLTISNSPIMDLSFLTSLQNLSYLELLNCRKVENFSFISSLNQLKRLALDGCSLLNSVDFINSLEKLEILALNDVKNIDSLKPVANLSNLKALSFAGTRTNIVDGNLSYLESLPLLSMLMFKARKHYSHILIKEWDWNNFEHPDTLLKKK